MMSNTTNTFPHLAAHRGLSFACPENTLPAFAAAAAIGAHEIELDLRSSRDGVPVVCHDESVDRTTNGSGMIREMEWKDIRKLDAGAKNHPEWAGVRIPRFEEVLEWADPSIFLNIHIKDIGEDATILEQVCTLLSRTGRIATSYLALDTERDLNLAREYDPEIPRACLANQSDPKTLLKIALRTECQRIQFFREAEKEYIQEARDHGLICNVFWSDEPEDARLLHEKGIDVVLTNCTHKLFAGGFPHR